MEKLFDLIIYLITKTAKVIVWMAVIIIVLLAIVVFTAIDKNGIQVPSVTTDKNRALSEREIISRQKMENKLTIFEKVNKELQLKFQSVTEEKLELEKHFTQEKKKTNYLEHRLIAKGDEVVNLTNELNNVVDDKQSLQIELVASKKAFDESEKNFSYACTLLDQAIEQTESDNQRYVYLSEVNRTLSDIVASYRTPIHRTIAPWLTLIIGLFPGFLFGYSLKKRQANSGTVATNRTLSLRAILNKAASWLL